MSDSSEVTCDVRYGGTKTADETLGVMLFEGTVRVTGHQLIVDGAPWIDEGAAIAARMSRSLASVSAATGIDVETLMAGTGFAEHIEVDLTDTEGFYDTDGRIVCLAMPSGYWLALKPRPEGLRKAPPEAFAALFDPLRGILGARLRPARLTRMEKWRRVTLTALAAIATVLVLTFLIGFLIVE